MTVHGEARINSFSRFDFYRTSMVLAVGPACCEGGGRIVAYDRDGNTLQDYTSCTRLNNPWGMVIGPDEERDGIFFGKLALAPVPEPGTYGLMLAGLASTTWVAHRRKA